MELFSTSLSPTANKTLPYLKPLVGLVAVSLLVCLAMYFGLLAPAEERHAEILATLNQLKDQQVTRVTAKSTQARLAKIWKKLPAPEEFSDLGVMITRLAKSNKVYIPGMQYHQDTQDKKKTGLATKGSITFEALGAYEDIRKFIFELETSGTYLIIEKLSAEHSKKTDDITFKLRIGTYFKPDSALSVKGLSAL